MPRYEQDSRPVSPQPFAPIPLHLASEMLQHVDSHDRDIWVQVGKALAAEYGEAAADVFDRWSAQADNYKVATAGATWRSCLRKPGAYTIGTVVKLALDGGFRFPSRSLTSDERTRLAAEREAQLAGRQRALEARRRREEDEAQGAVASALSVWREGLSRGTSSYLDGKGIADPESVKFTPAGWLLVPMLRYDLPRENGLKGLQVIRPDGGKKYSFGMEKAGTSCRLGLVVAGEPILVCEGYATGMSLRMALERRWPVFVAFDAGNLTDVAVMLHELHPASPLLLVADDDWKTVDRNGRPMNPGRVAAHDAASLVQERGGEAVMAHPVFAPSTPRRPEHTDFNDLHALEGLSAVRAQLLLALQVLQDPANV